MIPELVNVEDNDYWIEKTRIQIFGGSIDMVLHITSSDGSVDCWYDLKVKGVLEYRFSSGQDGDLLMLPKDHPLLAAYSDSRAQLYCQSKKERERDLLSALLVAHRKLAHDWIGPFDFINACSIKCWNHGMIADGPRSFIDAYYSAIASMVKTSKVLDLGPPRDWDGGNFQERVKDVIGLCFGHSYVIAENFELVSRSQPGIAE